MKRRRAGSFAIDEIFFRPTRERKREEMLRVAREHSASASLQASLSAAEPAAAVSERICIRGSPDTRRRDCERSLSC